ACTMELPVLAIWMMVSKESSVRTFGKTRIEAPFSVVTSACALGITAPSASAIPQRPERKASHFTVRIALLLSNRPNLLPFAPLLGVSRRAAPGIPRKCAHTYSKTRRIVKDSGAEKCPKTPAAKCKQRAEPTPKARGCVDRAERLPGAVRR